MVKHVIPENLHEALVLMNQERYKVIAGGTDLMIQKRSFAQTAPRFDQPMMYLFNLKELKYIIKSSQGISIGSMTSLEDLFDHPDTPPILKEVIIQMASPALRYVATLAGNIANASPAGDSLVALYLMDAVVVLESIYKTRRVPIDHLIIGPRLTTIEPHELIKEIWIPHIDYDSFQFIKVGGRKADAISKLSFLGLIRKENSKILDLRIALGAVAKTVVRNRDIEQILIEEDLNQLKTNPDIIKTLYEPLIQPIDDQRSNKHYRKEVTLNLIKNFIDQI